MHRAACRERQTPGAHTHKCGNECSLPHLCVWVVPYGSRRLERPLLVASTEPLPQVDHGAIVVQKAVPVLATDDAHTLAYRILVEEHKIYPAAIQLFAQGRLTVDGRKVKIS